jgi:methylmalonyl-CoA mutase cobalamin-binding subunit
VARTGPDLEQLQPDAVARGLRDAGFEVIYAPPSAGLDQLAEAALQEDADAVVLTGGDADATPDRGLDRATDAGADDQADLHGELASRGIDDVLVLVATGDPGEVAAELRRGLGAGRSS